MKPNFKEGDTVICINNTETGSGLVVDRKYKVLSTDIMSNERFCDVQDLQTWEKIYCSYEHRFIIARESPTPKQEFKVNDWVECIDTSPTNDDRHCRLTMGAKYRIRYIWENNSLDLIDVFGNTFSNFKAKRFKLTNQNTEMKFKCINAKDSNSLIEGDLYTKVDTNEHGNISVMTSKGRVLQHYYKPDRFVEVKEEVSAQISLDKKYQTKGGNEVKLFAISDDGKYPVVGQYKANDHGWLNQTWTMKGELYAGDESELNLVEAKPDQYWFNGDSRMVVNRKNKRVLLIDYSYSFEDILALAKEIGQ